MTKAQKIRNLKHQSQILRRQLSIIERQLSELRGDITNKEGLSDKIKALMSDNIPRTSSEIVANFPERNHHTVKSAIQFLVWHGFLVNLSKKSPALFKKI